MSSHAVVRRRLIAGILIGAALAAGCSGHRYAPGVAEIVHKAQQAMERNDAAFGDITFRYRNEDSSFVKDAGGTFKKETEIVLRRKGKKYRKEVIVLRDEMHGDKVEGKTFWTVFDGRNRWQVDFFGGMKKEKGNRFWYDELPGDTRLDGSAVTGGRDCYVLRYRLDLGKGGGRMFTAFDKTVWVDKATFSIARMESKALDGGTITEVYSDYRSVGGKFTMPFKVVRWTDSPVSSSTSTIVECTTDQGLDEKLFKPEEIVFDVDFWALDLQRKMQQNGQLTKQQKKAVKATCAYLEKMVERNIADRTAELKAQPGNEAAWYRRGNAWLAKQRYDEAATDYTRALALDPKDANALYHRGIAFAFKKDLPRATADFKSAVALGSKGAAEYLRLLTVQEQVAN